MEYTIKQVKTNDVWSNSYGEFQSYALVLEGIGEPVSMNKKAPVSNPPKAGDKIFGTLEEVNAKNGRSFYKFKAEKPQGVAPSTDKPTEEYWEDKNSAIKAQWAIGQAVRVAVAINEPEAYKNIETEAKGFYAMVERVKGNTEATSPIKTQQLDNMGREIDETYDLHPDAHTPINDIDDEPINLDSIPF